jgi:hypothetical protein
MCRKTNILMKTITKKWSRIFIAGLMFIQMPILIAGNKKSTGPLSFTDLTAPLSETGVSEKADDLYSSMDLGREGLSREAFLRAWQGYKHLTKKGIQLREHIITIADFSQPSTCKRLFVIDLDARQIVHKSLVAHGKNSGLLYANSFSNKPETNKSSLGFYLTMNTYTGEHGISLRLKGLEKNINDKAYERAIVIHGASYVSESFAKKNGFLGRSLGCPAIPDALAKPIIQSIKNGTLLFIYHPEKTYTKKSPLLKVVQS